MGESYSLRESLPPAVFGQASRGVASYRNYPAFSWPWWWRRSVIFAPIAVAIGGVNGFNVGIQLHDWELASRLSALGIFGWLSAAVGGPALAAIVRHRDLKPSFEKFFVGLAIVAGVIAAMGILRVSNALVRTEVYPRLMEQGYVTAQALEVTRSPLISRINLALLIVSLLAIGGALAIRTFLSERRRWQEHERETEMRKLRVQRDESDRRLTVLQAQVEPHFLFNTLASVRSLIKVDPRRAEATIDALVDHLRATLPKMRQSDAESHSTLDEQLEICRSYLEVMSVRMGDRLSYSIAVPEALRAMKFPPLVLISLVENAIKHGVEPKPGPCRINIDAARVEHGGHPALEVSVIDDGAGLRVGLGEGIGLSNIRAQLATRYGERAALKLQSGAAGGVIATLVLPLEGFTA